MFAGDASISAAQGKATVGRYTSASDARSPAEGSPLGTKTFRMLGTSVKITSPQAPAVNNKGVSTSTLIQPPRFASVVTTIRTKLVHA